MNPRNPWMVAALRAARSFLLFLVLLSGTLPLNAQTIRGRLLDGGTDTGIPQAIVEALHEGEVAARTLTDDEGRYEIGLGGRAPGIYILRASALGYPVQDLDPVTVRIQEAVEVDLIISSTPLALRGITVEVNRVNLRHAASYEGLYARRELAHSVGRERVVVRGDIEMEHASRVEDVLRHFFFREIPSRGGGSLRKYGTAYSPAGGICVDWYLNGWLRSEEWLANIPIDLVEGVEYYGSNLYMPMGFETRRCPPAGGAVVAVWTLRWDQP